MEGSRDLENVEKELKPIRYQSEKYSKVTSVINMVNVASLWDAHEHQKRGKAVGIDGVDKETYEEGLVEKLIELVNRMKLFKYIPKLVRCTYIPKANGKQRPLGIPSYEDKLVQCVMADVLNEIYEPRVLDCSLGFRLGCGAHDVVGFIKQAIGTKHVNYVLEADIKGFVDSLNQKWLLKFPENDIADKNFIRYIVRFLKAGSMEGTELQESDKGTPQGGLISPVLANVYLHYVLNLWITLKVKKMVFGEMYYVRYADNFIVLFQVEKEARMVLELLKERLAEFGLQMVEDKTCILPIGRCKGTKENFDFLGFNFYNAWTRKGSFRLGARSCEKKLKVKRQELKQWLKTRLIIPVAGTLIALNRKLVEHYNYYGGNGNWQALKKFGWHAFCMTSKMLRRRGQKHPISQEKFGELWKTFVRPPFISKEIWKCQPMLI